MPSLVGTTVVFTGTLSVPRTKATALAINAGANVSGTISRNTDYLVAGPGAGSKLRKAKGYGVKVISEEEFMNMTSGNVGSMTTRSRLSSLSRTTQLKPTIQAQEYLPPEIDFD
jgi:BRCT domain type II-containing protein